MACTFRWRQINDSWRGMIGDQVWTLAQDDNSIKCILHQNQRLSEEAVKNLITKYFQLKPNLQDLYRQWSNVDKNFASVSVQLPGIRMLQQDPVENVFSFICSSNNNIQR